MEVAEVAKEVAKTEAIGAAESALAEAQSELEAIYAEGRRTQSTMLREISVQQQKIIGAKNEVKKDLIVGNANNLPFEKDYFDLVISLNTLHNLYCYDMKKALSEIERVGKFKKYICIESYRNEFEKMNLLYWQVTCECFFTPEEWKWWFDFVEYKGDHSFIYFE